MPNQENMGDVMQKAVKDASMYRMVYPEVYYMVMPYVVTMCDQMDAYGGTMPTQEMVDQMTDHIYNNVCRMRPDMAECKMSQETINMPYDNPLGYGRGHRQPNTFRDLITILLLSEIFGRRRRYY